MNRTFKEDLEGIFYLIFVIPPFLYALSVACALQNLLRSYGYKRAFHWWSSRNNFDNIRRGYT